MESPKWPESLPSNRKKAIHELVQGQEWTEKLREVLGWSDTSNNPDPKSIDGLLVQILGMFESTLSIMGCNEQPPLPSTGLHAFHSPKSEKFDESHHGTTVIPVKTKRGCYKRRKNVLTSTEITSILIDDGHAWRKYGQKEILNSRYERSYYRCTYKYEQGCLATKQVQKIEDKPTNYKITYFGHHTCTNLQRAPPIILDMPDPRDTSILVSFGAKGLIEKKQVDPYFPTMKNHEQSMDTPMSSNTIQSWDHFTHVSQIPVESVSMISSSFDDHVDMISPGVYPGLDHGDPTLLLESYLPITRTTQGYHEMEHMIMGMNAFNELPY
uniref:probable WRKY transcription factor 70 n=1 Tax=Erigeron canadensis TaxID=72917 RepID=UPI001CB892AC|nr:probable WRKY transcription factor 70 [Erigeron canadensis]